MSQRRKIGVGGRLYMGDQQPAIRDDRYILDRVLPRWQFDAFEFLPTDSPTQTLCMVTWMLETLTCGVYIHLNVPMESSATTQRYGNCAAPFWTAPTLDVPRETGVVHKAWTDQRQKRPGTNEKAPVLLVPAQDDASLVLTAPFEVFSRKVFWFDTRIIRLQKRIPFDLGLRNAITHTAGKLRTKGVTW